MISMLRNEAFFIAEIFKGRITGVALAKPVYDK
jgi:hypothetical protein